MEIKDQVCSFEQAEKLVILGARLETLNYWNNCTLQSIRLIKQEEHLCFPAPTVAELGVLLPAYIHQNEKEHGLKMIKGVSMHKVLYQCGELKRYTIYEGEWGETEAQARAAALIWLIENKYLKAGDLSC